MPPRRTCWHSPPSPTDLAPKLVEQPQDGFDKEIRRRTDVVGIFSDCAAPIPLVGAALAEHHDEWIESRRYLGLYVLSKSRADQSSSPE